MNNSIPSIAKNSPVRTTIQKFQYQPKNKNNRDKNNELFVFVHEEEDQYVVMSYLFLYKEK